jgi:hypothetical protein
MTNKDSVEESTDQPKEWEKEFDELLITFLAPHHAYNIIINSEGKKNKLKSFISQNFIPKSKDNNKENNK